MNKIVLLLLMVFCADLLVARNAFAETPTPDNRFDTVAQELDKAKAETQRLKDAWDKERLEATLYEQRMKRAAQKFAKAAKDVKTKAKEQKERAELEFQLAVEKRKLAYNVWQAAQLRAVAKETELKALDQERDSAVVRARIEKIQKQLAADRTK